jgi:hypothetical protein
MKRAKSGRHEFDENRKQNHDRNAVWNSSICLDGPVFRYGAFDRPGVIFLGYGPGGIFASKVTLSHPISWVRFRLPPVLFHFANGVVAHRSTSAGGLQMPVRVLPSAITPVRGCHRVPYAVLEQFKTRAESIKHGRKARSRRSARTAAESRSGNPPET